MQGFGAGIIMAIGLALATAAGAQTPAEPGAPLVPAVRTVVVEAPATEATRQFFGQVRARETVDLSFRVGGTLLQLIPEEGMRVASGDMLAQLDLAPLTRAVERATLALSMATRDADRATALANRQVGAAASAEDATTARDLAEVALRDARAALDDATLRAPFDGLVAMRITPAFSAVTPGQPILRLHDMSEVRVEFALPERVFQQIGDLSEASFAALIPGREAMPLRVVAFQPETGRVGQSYTVILALTGDGAGLLPGASVTVTVSAVVPSALGGSVSIPVSALLAGNDRDASVYVLDGTGGQTVARAQAVTVLATSGAGFAVTGIAPGTEIVAAGAHLLTDGQPVRRFIALSTAEN